MRFDRVACVESTDFQRLVGHGIDDENLLSQHLCAFFKVKPHRAFRHPDVIVFLTTYALHVVLANRPRRGETWHEHLAAAAEAEEQMRLDCPHGNDQVGLA